MTVIQGCHRSLTNTRKCNTPGTSRPFGPVEYTCDASDFAVGGVLQQYIDNVWQLFSFFSKQLNPAETR